MRCTAVCLLAVVVLASAATPVHMAYRNGEIDTSYRANVRQKLNFEKSIEKHGKKRLEGLKEKERRNKLTARVVCCQRQLAARVGTVVWLK